MKELGSVWKEAKKRCNKLERSLVDCHIAFLRQVARVYLKQGRRVFFKENRVVHWGEGGFGWLVIEGKEKPSEVFGEYLSEIRFEPIVTTKVTKGYKEIKREDLKDIRYSPLTVRHAKRIFCHSPASVESRRKALGHLIQGGVIMLPAPFTSEFLNRLEAGQD